MLRHSVPVRVLACALAIAVPTSAQSAPRPARAVPVARGQTANVALEAQDNALLLFVTSFGKKYTVDSAKLHFTIIAPNAKGARTPFPAEIGEPVSDRSYDQEKDGTLTVYHVPIAFPERPERPGMYDVALVTEPGFVRYEDGTAMRVEPIPHANVYWPDDFGADAGLLAASAAIDGRAVYGYGGIALSCGAASSKTYLANVGVDVQGVERRHGAVQQLWTGAMTSWGNDAAYSFFAVDPLAVTASYPSASPFGSSGSSAPAGDAPCPGFFLADPWHLEVTLTPVKPPPLPSGYAQFKIAVGMTRAEVARRRGYPQGYYTARALNVMPVWSYYDGPGDAYTVTFREGRVAAFTVPIGLP